MLSFVHLNIWLKPSGESIIKHALKMSLKTVGPVWVSAISIYYANHAINYCSCSEQYLCYPQKPASLCGTKLQFDWISRFGGWLEGNELWWIVTYTQVINGSLTSTSWYTNPSAARLETPTFNVFHGSLCFILSFVYLW